MKSRRANQLNSRVKNLRKNKIWLWKRMRLRNRPRSRLSMRRLYRCFLRNYSKLLGLNAVEEVVLVGEKRLIEILRKRLEKHITYSLLTNSMKLSKFLKRFTKGCLIFQMWHTHYRWSTIRKVSWKKVFCMLLYLLRTQEQTLTSGSSVPRSHLRSRIMTSQNIATTGHGSSSTKIRNSLKFLTSNYKRSKSTKKMANKTHK